MRQQRTKAESCGGDQVFHIFFYPAQPTGSDVHGGRGRPPPRLLQLHGLHGVTGVIQR
jgi:hypothetical protein